MGKEIPHIMELPQKFFYYLGNPNPKTKSYLLLLLTYIELLATTFPL